MTKRILNEGLDYHDLVGQMLPKLTVDEYSAKMGEDDEIVTLAFTVKGKQVGEDLCDWFERGYDWVLDAQVSEGEIVPGKYLVFVELNRRTNVVGRIIELLEDLTTLTDIQLKDWTIEIEGEEYEPNIEILKKKITLSPHEYRVDTEREEELNEMRIKSGMEPKELYSDLQDDEIKAFKAMAGL